MECSITILFIQFTAEEVMNINISKLFQELSQNGSKVYSVRYPTFTHFYTVLILVYICLPDLQINKIFVFWPQNLQYTY